MIFHIIGWLLISLGSVFIIGNVIYNWNKNFGSIDGYLWGSVLIATGIIVGFVGADSYNNMPNNYCPDHLDECVLENENCPDGYSYIWQDVCFKYNYTTAYGYNPYKKSVKNYHFKTDCEKNPREDADCVCDRKILSEEKYVLYCKMFEANVTLESSESGFGFTNMENLMSIENLSDDCNIKKIEEKVIGCVSARERTWQEVCEYKNMTYRTVLINNAKLEGFSGSEFEVCLDEKRSDTKNSKGEPR